MALRATRSVPTETRCDRPRVKASRSEHTAFALVVTSDQAKLPAELKHVDKRRKRNQQGFPQ